MSIKSLRLSEAAIAGCLHPLTGNPIVPVGFLPNGRAVWPIMGGSGEDDEEDGDESKAKSGENGGSGSGDDSDGDNDDENSAGDAEAKANEALKAKNSQLIKEKRATQARADEAERVLRELKEKDLPEVERLTTRIAEQENQIQNLTGELRSARLDAAFLRDNTYAWHNPGRALQVADLSDVDIDEEGKVTGLKEALDALAKSDPYLIKSGDETKKKDPPKSGDQPKGKPKGTSQEQENARLKAKYSALRR